MCRPGVCPTYVRTRGVSHLCEDPGCVPPMCRPGVCPTYVSTRGPGHPGCVPPVSIRGPGTREQGLSQPSKLGLEDPDPGPELCVDPESMNEQWVCRAGITIPPVSGNGLLKSEPQNKANILNIQFQDAFTSITSKAIPDKGPCPHPSMPDINITKRE
ncbi:hypothetical protein DPMN_192567 [Dreissena polymorpha]|uniref:Uncharacterized protein n=1 Tax=Dreissena polymorpha TaxID=45954 RepID=A0A9D3Y4N7_DREPO|nr:hypothetical protein DPMN_192567 [Dreissena polymorpha]